MQGTELETVYYTYGDSQWKDKLTSFNGQTISYDAMGNPTSYLGKTLVWEGKRLTSLTIPGTNTSRPTTYSYAYNEDGLRLSKLVEGTTTEYYYNGSVLIGMKIGTGSSAKMLRFSYDASGNVVAVDYSSDNGSSFTTYYYLRNAQNDVIKLIDGGGNTVVEYTYDSWGKLLSSTGTLANTVGTYQPFRYRGYVYDTETQWYYLQSRYYDSATCRFISADIYLSTGQGVLGHNSFAYCLNSPTNYADYDGMLSDTLVAGGGTLISSIFSALLAIGGSNFWNIAGWVALGILVTALTVMTVIALVNNIKASRDKKLSVAKTFLESCMTAASPLPPNDPRSNGTKTNGSYKLYEKGKVRVEVENFGNNSVGKVHLQIKGCSSKYYYDVEHMQFVDELNRVAPKAIQEYLNNADIANAIAQGLRILGY